ncbi:MAG TPA: transporter substrate-binding domain-containing protein, partial [Synergistales bacterium]|nr:transporter substrate-binding domain-containing protein [Synergistales bacterium]
MSFRKIMPAGFMVLVAIVLVLVFSSLPVLPSFAGTTVKVGIYENKPKVFTDDPGRPAGIFVDIIEAVAASEGWQIEYVRGTWSEGLDRLAAGEIDLMPDVAYTAEREKRFSFHSEPVLSDWFQVYAIKGSGITSILDLDGKRVSVLERSIQEEAFGRLVEGFDLDVDTVPFPDYASAFLSVREGKVDAVITNRFYGVMHLGNSGLEDTAVIFNPTRLFFAASKGVSPSFLATLDDRLAEMKREPGSAYFQSLKRWT